MNRDDSTPDHTIQEQPPMDRPTSEQQPAFLTRIVEAFLRADVAVLLIVVSLVLGAVSLVLTPREEEPQIVVPLADVLVQVPGLSAEEVERQVTTRLENLLFQIDGVEYVYSMSAPGQAIVTVRFHVGEDREESLVKLYNKIHSNQDAVPPQVSSWVIKPLEIDDVPIVNVTLWSNNLAMYSDYELRRIAEQLRNELQAIPDTNRVQVIGGRPRRVRVELDGKRLASLETSALQVAEALQVSNVAIRTQGFDQQNEHFLVEAGTRIADVRQLEDLVVNVADGRPVYLKDVAAIHDGPAEVDGYSWMGFGPADELGDVERDQLYPAVHLTVAKRKGTNAVRVAEAVEQRMQRLSSELLPDGIEYRLTRDYGETADHKVDELVEGLVVAVLTVIGLMGLTLGWRAALVIALAVPVCYSLTLFVNYLCGYTINRVTLFALILALGLLVDDPITDVENIARYFSMRILPPRQATLMAIQEVRPALILSTLAIICSFLPLAFITGMMGPYMGPMALNVPLTVMMSTVVAFVITPWLAMVSLKSPAIESMEERNVDQVAQTFLYRFYSRTLGLVLGRTGRCLAVLAVVVVLFLAATVLPLLRTIPLKMLPYDNKNEFQVIIDVPEGTTLDQTNSIAMELARFVGAQNEVVDYQVYAGTPSAMDFNGLVRHYFMRSEAHTAEIRVNLFDKDRRQQQSHEIVLRLREPLTRRAEQLGARVKLVEVPPGPPVLSTITGEVRGPGSATYDELITASRTVAERLEREPGIVDVDVSGGAEQIVWAFEPDQAKAALSGISTETIARTIQIALDGLPVSVLQTRSDVEPVWIELRMPRAQRSAMDDLEELYVVGTSGQLVQLAALGRFTRRPDDQIIYHKNLERVAFVYGEVAGRPPADAILDLTADRNQPRASAAAIPLSERSWLQPGGGDGWSLPAGFDVDWAGEGEWKITLDVFRDLGIAFAAALLGIFVILMFQTGSRILPVIIMLAIPLTLIGILPGFWLLNLIVNRPVGGFENPVFFTATAMIGMIGLAGIVVRNSVVLIDFIHMDLKLGRPFREAILRSATVRTRPILLTAGTTLLGNWVITLDPIFSGLAWSIIFGIVASTLFTLVVIPLVYSLTGPVLDRGDLEQSRGSG